MENVGVHMSVLVVAFLMGVALGWINLGDEVKNYGAAIVLTLIVAVAGAALLVFLVPDADITTEPPPTGGRIDMVLSQWGEAIIGVVFRQSPAAFWVGLLAGIGAFLYWKRQRATSS